MPPSSSSKSPSPSPSGSKSSSHYILIALSILIVAGFVVMYFKVDLLSKDINTVAQQAEQKTPPPAPALQVAQPPEQTPPRQTIIAVYTDPTTGLIFAVPSDFGPENYTFKKESVAGTELVSKISVKRVEDGNIPACASWFSIGSVGGPTDPDAVLVTAKYMVSAPAADCEVIVKEKSDWTTYTSGNFQFSYPSGLTPTVKPSNAGITAVEFTDANDKSAFRLACPIPEIGFEAWNFTNQKRSFPKDGKTYNATLMLGTPIAGSEDLGNFNVILMNSGTDVTSKDSCMLTSDTDKTISLYQGIYESVK